MGCSCKGHFLLVTIINGIGSSEIVIEHAQTNKVDEAKRWMLGFNYWLDPRSVIKVGYEDTDVADGPDDKRFAVQFSYGF